MKIPRQFVLFLVIAQSILTAGHALLAWSLLFFFPGLHLYSGEILITLLFISVSFLFFSFATWNSENSILRIGYIISSVLILVWFYSLLASILGFAMFFIWPSAVGNLAALFYGLAVLLTIYGLINARTIRVTELRIKLPNIPEIWRGKTAVLVSDLHLGLVLRKGFAQKVIQKINSLKPEIVFLPGDFFDGVKTDFEALAGLFRQVKASRGIYFSSGNHEQFAGMDACEHALRGAGIQILENEIVEMDGLQILGTAYGSETEDHLREILRGMNIDRTRPSILLKHVPNHMQAVMEYGVSLQLSGHSHHGQVWPGRLVTKRVWKGFDYGLKRLGSLQVYVSSGVGTWGPPMRVFTKSEIVKIIFE